MSDPQHADPQPDPGPQLGLGREGFTLVEAPLAAAFQAALRPDDAQVRRLLAGLPAIQTRARHRHRRRLAEAGGLVLALAGVVVLALSGPGFLRSVDASPADSAPFLSDPVQVTRESLLQVDSIPLGGGVSGRSSILTAPRDLSGQAVRAGICTDSAPTVTAPGRAWTAGWDVPASESYPSVQLFETIWQWDDVDQAANLIPRLRDQLDGCSAAHRPEGVAVRELNQWVFSSREANRSWPRPRPPGAELKQSRSSCAAAPSSSGSRRRFPTWSRAGRSIPNWPCGA
jgi:hypothetical protein